MTKSSRETISAHATVPVGCVLQVRRKTESAKQPITFDKKHVHAPYPPLRNKTILITGGASFIGSSLAEKVVEHNRVILFDRSFVCGPIQYTSLLRHPNITSIQGNILDADLRSLVKDADLVVHGADTGGVNRIRDSAQKTLETNYIGTSRLLNALGAARKIQRFVYFSTCEVFEVSSFRVDEVIAGSRWSDAISKLASECLIASYFRETHLPITIVRPFNIFGPRRTSDYAIRRFVLNALQGRPLEIPGKANELHSWCYIEDFCSALVQAMVSPEAIGEDFNIGNPGNTLTIYELAKKVVELMSSTSVVRSCDSPFPEVPARIPSVEKARSLLGYQPKYDLDTGLKLTIDWHRENCDLFHQNSVAAPSPFLDVSWTREARAVSLGDPPSNAASFLRSLSALAGSGVGEY